MTPHLVRWHRTYGPRGLKILYVDNGRKDTLARLEGTLQSEGWPYAAVHDADGRATDAYGVRAFPTAWVLDRNGRVVWSGVPLGTPSPAERAIEAALAR